MGVGRWFMRDAANAAQAPVGPPTPANPSAFVSTTPIGGGSTYYANITGVASVNKTRTEGTEFDNRGTLGLNGANVGRYPDLILQARANDSVTFTINIVKRNSGETEHVKAWVTYNSGTTWTEFGYIIDNTALNFTFNYTIPSGTPNGNHAVLFSMNYNSTPQAPPSSGAEQSNAIYSLEIW